jgi:hypothetical protein
MKQGSAKNIFKIKKIGPCSQGDAVSFLAEPSPADCPTMWVAKQVLINDETAALLQVNPIEIYG